ncbi:MAG: alpha/beta hydrolase [Desulfobacterales bacterium]|jgi:acetyl esterase|nr:alpha/beta hydrolase [Desulfobacteraceae bacterium]MBT7085095.1 alpha/beta hydrolase [Desulfobacterales bacterium]MBT7697736.1 alpha/beta hydrolase [Desulfobacterales bacterium]
MPLIIKDGPNGQTGGVPFPEVKQDIEEMEKAGKAFNPIVLKIIPQFLIPVKKIREAMGHPNKDIARSSLTSRAYNIPGPNGDVPIRVYSPEGENLPILIFYHGGGWIGGSMDAVENICRGIADRAKCVVINVGYRLAPEHKFPIGLEDAYASILWTADNAALIGGDPNQILVGGDSAGGNLAAACCLMTIERKGPKLVGQILLYAVTNIFASCQDPNFEMAHFNMIARLYVKNKKQLSHPYCSPALADDMTVMPPTLVVTAEFCPFMNDGETFAQKLSDEGVQVKAIRYNGLNHAFLDKVGVWKYANDCIEDIATFLSSEI